MPPDNNPQNIPPLPQDQGGSDNPPPYRPAWPTQPTGQSQAGRAEQPRTVFSPPLQLPGTQFDQYTAPQATSLPPPEQQGSYVLPGYITAQAEQPGQPQTRKRLLRKLLIMSVGVIGAGLIGFAVYYFYFVPRKPENVVAKAIATTAQQLFQRQLRANLEGTLKLSEAGNEDNPIVNASIGGSFNGTSGYAIILDNSFPAKDGPVKIKTTLQTLDYKTFYVKTVGLTPTSAKQLQAANETEGVEPSAGTQIIGELIENLDSVLPELNNQWFSLAAGDLTAYTGKKADGAVPVDSSTSLAAVADVYRRHPFIVVNNTLGEEVIDGDSSQHYQVTISTDRFKAFLREAKSQKIQTPGIDSQRYDSMIAQLNKQDRAPLFDIWISSHGLVKQLTYSFAEKSGTKLSLKITLTDYENPRALVVPTKVKSFAPVLETFFDKTVTTDPAAVARDAERKKDISLLQAKVAEYFALNGHYPQKISETPTPPAEACRQPGGSGTCDSPDYGYKAFRLTTPPNIGTSSDCNNKSEKCQSYILYSEHMETITSKVYSLSSN